MKKLLIAALTMVLGSFGYAIVDATLENRVSDLEASYIALSEQFDNYTATKKETTTKKDENVSIPETNTDMFSQTEIYTEITDNIQDEFVGFGGGVTPSEVPRPAVTYYDKYVEDVIRSRNYTMSMQMNDGGQNKIFEIYSEGDRKSYKGTVNFDGITMSFRFFEKDDKTYIVILPTLLVYFELDKADPFVEKIESEISTYQDTISVLTSDELTYCGISSGVGYVCESYKDSNGTIYNYYFNSSGLTRVETVDLETNECMSNAFTLTAGVSDKGVFEIPKGYKKTTVQELEGIMGGMM